MNKKERQEILEEMEKDPVFNIRRWLNSEIITREDFHRYYSRTRNFGDLFTLAKQRIEKYGN